MVRAHFTRPVQSSTGALVPVSSVKVVEDGTDTNIAQTIYTGATGGESRPNPFVVNDGVIDFYLDYPQTVTLKVTPSGGSEVVYVGMPVISADISGLIAQYVAGDDYVDGMTAQEGVDNRVDKETTGLLAYAENNSGDATFFGPSVGGGAAQPIPGCVVLVPGGPYNVELVWGANLTNTGSTFTGGTRGVLYTLLYEITTGSAVAIDSCLSHHSLGINYITSSFAQHRASFMAGHSDTDRVYALYVQCVTEAGSGALAGAARNLNGAGRSFLQASAV